MKRDSPPSRVIPWTERAAKGSTPEQCIPAAEAEIFDLCALAPELAAGVVPWRERPSYIAAPASAGQHTMNFCLAKDEITELRAALKTGGLI